MPTLKSQPSHDKNPPSKSSKVWHDGFSYTFHKTLKNGSHYRCSCWRSEKECNAILKVFDNNQVSASGEHTSGCSRRNDVLISGTISSGNKCTDHMYRWIEQRATDLHHLHDTPAVVRQDCVAHFTNEVGPSFYGLDKTHMRNLVYHAREKTFGGNTISKVETQYGGTNKAAFMSIAPLFLMMTRCSE